jgi:sugar lactone lactonase YvrE
MAATTIHCAIESDDVLGETPLWCDRTQSLLWIDIDRALLHRHHPASGSRDTFRFEARHLGSLALQRTGGVLVALDASLHSFDFDSGTLQPLCSVESASLDTRLNDGRCDAAGRLWIGTMDNGLAQPSGSFYRVDPDGKVIRQFGDVIVPNTVAIAPDQRTLYFSDTRRFVTWAFDLDVHAGVLSNRRIFVDHRATWQRPDGACIDADGCVWTAIFAGGRVVRYTPTGRADRTIELPVTNPTCPCLGGSDLRTLYITSARKFLSDEQLRAEPLAGSVLAVQVSIPGLPEQCFAG